MTRITRTKAPFKSHPSDSNFFKKSKTLCFTSKFLKTKLLILAILLLYIGYLRARWTSLIPEVLNSASMEFAIKTTWDGKPVTHDPVKLRLEPSGSYVKLITSAPFFNDPSAPPDGKYGEPYNKLWDYEVVEAFFLASDNKYLEVEVSPHGQHLLLLLNGARNAIKLMLPMNYSAETDGSNWKGVAYIPKDYFPPNAKLFNAYAIHGSGTKRTYEALFPAPLGKHDDPDFHRLEYFKEIDFASLAPENKNGHLSKIWKDSLNGTGA